MAPLGKEGGPAFHLISEAGKTSAPIASRDESAKAVNGRITNARAKIAAAGKWAGIISPPEIVPWLGRQGLATSNTILFKHFDQLLFTCYDYLIINVLL
jgi:hypothetical protein